MGEPTPRERVLVISAAPVFPTVAGNRRRILTVCDILEKAGHAIDFAYFGVEDVIYRMAGKLAPTDHAAMTKRFERYFYIECRGPLRLRTQANSFMLDDWAGGELLDFVLWYFRETDTAIAVVNYVFLSRAFLAMPRAVFGVLDTHDRFSARRTLFEQQRSRPAFFFLDAKSETEGLNRADLILAIEEREGLSFANRCNRPVLVLPHWSPLLALSTSRPRGLRAIGFIGHGNEPNVISIRSFAQMWSGQFVPGVSPILRVAGEVCEAFRQTGLRGVEFLGFQEDLGSFYRSVDLIVAPMILGTGQNIKVVEALAYGKVVVGTGLAFRGLDSRLTAHNFARLDEMVAFLHDLSRHPDKLGPLYEACMALRDAYSARYDDLVTVFEERLRFAMPGTGRDRFDNIGNRAEVTAVSDAFLFDGYMLWNDDGPAAGEEFVTRTFQTSDGKRLRAEGRAVAWTRQSPSTGPEFAYRQPRWWFLGTVAEWPGPVSRSECRSCRLQALTALAPLLERDALQMAPTFRAAIGRLALDRRRMAWLLHHLTVACVPRRLEGILEQNYPGRIRVAVLLPYAPRRRPEALWGVTCRNGNRFEMVYDPNFFESASVDTPPPAPSAEADAVTPLTRGTLEGAGLPRRLGAGATIGLWIDEQAVTISLLDAAS